MYKSKKKYRRLVYNFYIFRWQQYEVFLCIVLYPKSFEYPKLYPIMPQAMVEFKFCSVNFKKEEKWQQLSREDGRILSLVVHLLLRKRTF